MNESRSSGGAPTQKTSQQTNRIFYFQLKFVTGTVGSFLLSAAAYSTAREHVVYVMVLPAWYENIPVHPA